ncbi:hypothetical protein [Moraxella cuniculi]|nr:hypothetical protein [Moraxella cuniculi]
MNKPKIPPVMAVFLCTEFMAIYASNARFDKFAKTRSNSLMANRQHEQFL